MKGEFIYANGMTIGNVRKIAKFYFGSFYVDAKKNDKQMIFEIYLKDKIETKDEVMALSDYIDVDYFKEFWGNAWKLILTKEEDI